MKVLKRTRAGVGAGLSWKKGLSWRTRLKKTRKKEEGYNDYESAYSEDDVDEQDNNKKSAPTALSMEGASEKVQHR